MAEAVSDDTAAKHGDQAPFFRPTQREIIVNPRRFGFAYFVLAIGVGVAVGLAIVLIGRGSHHAATVGTKTFQPTRSGELGAKQIARHVGLKYRQANGAPFVGVVGERPNYEGQPLLFYLIRPHDAQDPSKDIAVFPVGNGIMYSMCGFGKNCAVGQTGETQDDILLLKREALELTIDTFKADSSVQTVTTLLPPYQQGTLALIFTRSDLAPQLQHSLASVLPEPGPLKAGQINVEEGRRIDALESGSLYLYDAVQGPDGNPYLRLDPIG